MWKYGSRTINVGQAWTSDDGTQHPGNWYLWSAEEKIAAGLSEIVEEAPPDARLFTWSQNGDGTLTTTAKSLEDVKAARKQALAGVRYQHEIGGVVVGGTPVNTERDSQSMMTGALKCLQDGLITAPIKWKGGDGVFVNIDETTLSAVCAAVATYVQACFANEAALCASIDACTSGEDVIAVDLESGWPS